MNCFLRGKHFQWISKYFNMRLKWLFWYLYLNQKWNAKFIGMLMDKFNLIPTTFHKRKLLALYWVIFFYEKKKVNLISFNERNVISRYLENNCPNYFIWLKCHWIMSHTVCFQKRRKQSWPVSLLTINFLALGRKKLC